MADLWQILTPIIVFVVIYVLKGFKIVKEYERAIIYRLGQLRTEKPAGPGLFYVIPCIETFVVFDLRTQVAQVPCSNVLTKDSLTLSLESVMFFKIVDPLKTMQNVENYFESTVEFGAVTLRNILGLQTLQEILFNKTDGLHANLMSSLNQQTAEWGIVVDNIEIRSISLPDDIQRSMAAEAEESKRSKAKVIAAEGEATASHHLKMAADIMSSTSSAMELRYLQTLHQAATENSHTIVFPMPTQILDMIEGREAINWPIFDFLPSADQSRTPPPAYHEVNKNDVLINLADDNKTAF